MKNINLGAIGPFAKSKEVQLHLQDDIVALHLLFPQ